MKNRETVVATATCAMLAASSPSAAQVQTDHQGWRTSRDQSQCMTYRGSGDIYQTKLFGVSGGGGQKFIIFRLEALKYPSFLQGPSSRTLPVLIIGRNDVVHRLQVRLNVISDGRNLNLVIEEDIIPFLLSGTQIQISYPGDIGQNVTFDYGDLSVGLRDYEQCERIRTGAASEQTQSADPTLDELPPFERAKRICEHELQQTGGLAPADNPYVLDGRRYKNACEAAADFAYRRATRFRSVE